MLDIELFGCGNEKRRHISDKGSRKIVSHDKSSLLCTVTIVATRKKEAQKSSEKSMKSSWLSSWTSLSKSYKLATSSSHKKDEVQVLRHVNDRFRKDVDAHGYCLAD